MSSPSRATEAAEQGFCRLAWELHANRSAVVAASFASAGGLTPMRVRDFAASQYPRCTGADAKPVRPAAGPTLGVGRRGRGTPFTTRRIVARSAHRLHGLGRDLRALWPNLAPHAAHGGRHG